MRSALLVFVASVSLLAGCVPARTTEILVLPSQGETPTLSDEKTNGILGVVTGFLSEKGFALELIGSVARPGCSAVQHWGRDATNVIICTSPESIRVSLSDWGPDMESRSIVRPATAEVRDRLGEKLTAKIDGIRVTHD
jgi:hypothetical protein